MLSFPNISPVAFSIFGIDFRWYALAYIAGFIGAFALMRKLAAYMFGARISVKDLDDMVGWAVVGVIIGGRLGYVLFYNWDYYSGDLLGILKIWQGGMAFHGGFLGAIAAIWVFARRRGLDVWALWDLAAVATPIGLFFGRIANFINGELYGRPTDAWFGMVFPAADDAPRHASQLYQAFLEGLVLFAIMIFMFNVLRIRQRRGVLGFSLVAFYAFFRFIVEFAREPDAHLGLFGGLSMGQWLSMPMFIIGAAGVWWRWRRGAVPAVWSSLPILSGVDGVGHYFFTRNGGASEGVFSSLNCRPGFSDKAHNVERNRKIVSEIAGIKKLFTVNQVHGDVIVVIDGDAPVDAVSKIDADAIITSVPGVGIGVLTADCAPLLLSSKDGRWVAAVHCGWKSLNLNIVRKVVEKFFALGVGAADIVAAIGPAMHQASYEVDEDFMAPIGDPSLFRRGVGEKRLFDLVGMCVKKLRAAGVREIDVSPFDTYACDDLYFSYRRSGVRGEYGPMGPLDEGRQISVVVKREGAAISMTEAEAENAIRPCGRRCARPVCCGGCG
ncbi:MAG: prolipoprotein diacylglyceryl transferase [Alphaproteobacteria bacterium]|nr:prolipoprotein diacylglyceryl transferase [Alphaproteobacteria bacterium]